MLVPEIEEIAPDSLLVVTPARNMFLKADTVGEARRWVVGLALLCAELADVSAKEKGKEGEGLKLSFATEEARAAYRLKREFVCFLSLSLSFDRRWFLGG